MQLPSNYQALSLINPPSPLTRLEGVGVGCEVWCKHDEQIGGVYGGNKVRKLEYLLADAKRHHARTLLTTGALGSHHVLATSFYGKAQGFNVEAVMLPQPYSDHAANNLRAVLALGTKVHLVRDVSKLTWTMLGRKLALTMSGRRPYMIGPGGSSAVGSLGFVRAGLELAEQIEQGDGPLPNAIFVTLGSGGTVAGLAIGLALSGLRVDVRAVRVVPAWMANRATLWVLIRKTVALLTFSRAERARIAERALASIQIDETQFGAGYGSATDAGKQAQSIAAAAGLKLELTYTAKTFAGMLSALKDSSSNYQRVLYWHTYNNKSLDAVLANAAPLPEHLRVAFL